ncbi:MAG: T9SS type A sorting domain-containing protein [Elusimicrobia bacterium]|nr:T9SS type A sorting domain-containing protein [Elusimicrobiota bacterium]
MSKRRKFAVSAIAWGLAFLSFAAVNAVMSSKLYRILISELVSAGNTRPKTGAGYVLFGSTGQLGYGAVSGGKYSINWGTVNSSPPSRADVSSAHAFPNPCSFKAGCNSVTFTGLTLQATVKVYTISGELVRTIAKSGNTDRTEPWDLKNAAGRQLASGLYLYLVEGKGAFKKGKLVIVR